MPAEVYQRGCNAVNNVLNVLKKSRDLNQNETPKSLILLFCR